MANGRTSPTRRRPTSTRLSPRPLQQATGKSQRSTQSPQPQPTSNRPYDNAAYNQQQQPQPQPQNYTYAPSPTADRHDRYDRQFEPDNHSAPRAPQQAPPPPPPPRPGKVRAADEDLAYQTPVGLPPPRSSSTRVSQPSGSSPEGYYTNAYANGHGGGAADAAAAEFEAGRRTKRTSHRAG